MAPTEPSKKKQAGSNGTPNRTSVLRRVAGNASLRGNSGQGANLENARFSSWSDTLDDYYQEMSRVDVAMELFNNNIYENVAGVHLEIKTRVENGEAGGDAAPVSHHLNQKLPTPPLSPGSAKSKTPNNPADLKARQEQRAKIHQALLKDETFGSLLRRDTYFHALMNDLDGLRQWWESCRLEWRNRRGEMTAMEKTLNALASQKRRLEAQLKERKMIGPKGAAKAAELSRLEKQYTRQMAQLNDTCRWFGETTKLMNAVKLRFKELKLESKDAEKDLQPKDALPADFEYVMDGSNPADTKTTSNAPQLPKWWQSNSPLWWLNHAATELDKKGHDIQASIATNSAILDECRGLLDDTKRDIREFEKNQDQKIEATEKEIEVRRQEMQEKYAKNPERRVSLEENLIRLYHLGRSTDLSKKKEVQYKKGLVAALEKEQEMRLFDQKDLTVRLERIQAMTRLARSAHEAVRKMIASIPMVDITLGYIVARLSIIHDLCCVHARRTEPSQRLREIVNNGVLSHDDKIQLTSQQESHFRHWEPRYLPVIKSLNATTEGYLDVANVLQKALEETKQEFNDLLGIVNGAEQLLKARETAVDQPITIASHAPTVVTTEQLKGQSWGQIKTVQDAKAVLNEPDSRGISVDKKLGEILRDFFTSPDVAPNFENISKLTKADFFDLINTFVDDDYAFTPREVEAFLLYCNDIGELFILINDYVSASGDGWELVDESPIGGPPRQLTLLPPSLAEDFAAWMVKNQAKILGSLRIAGAQRDTEEDTLIFIIRKYSPYPMDNEALQSLFSYFSHSGRFFRYLPTLAAETGQPILRRINNGWNIDPSSELFELFDSPKSYFLPIRRAITGKFSYGILPKQFTVYELYATLQRDLNGFKYGGFLGMGQKKVTMHKFYLFLTCCEQMKDLFELKRNGIVRPIVSGWDKVF